MLNKIVERSVGVLPAMNVMSGKNVLQKTNVSGLRTDVYLRKKLEEIWQVYFPDIKRLNEVHIVFGRDAKTRLGSIKWGPGGSSIITLTGYFRYLEIPDCVIEVTIAHELAHYAHGFFSPHEQKYIHPHQGGVVRMELINRGLKEKFLLHNRWLRAHWDGFIKKSKRRSQMVVFKKIFKIRRRKK